jgi:hypothetical protein
LDGSQLFQLADALECGGVTNARAVARGVVLALDDLAEERAPAGDVGRYGDRAIARAVGFDDGDAGILIKALVSTGILACHVDHRLVLIGWSARADDTVHTMLARSRTFFADGSQPRTRKIGDAAERRELAQWFALEAERRGVIAADARHETGPIPAAEAPCKMQLLLFSDSGSEAEAEEEAETDRREGEREREGTSPRAAPRQRRPRRDDWTPADDKQWVSCCAAFAAYGMPVLDPTLDRPRMRLLRHVLRTYPHRTDVLAEHVHGYIARHAKAPETWDALEHLTPETVFGVKRGAYLTAFDRAIARGLSPPFQHRAPVSVADPHRAAREAWARTVDVVMDLATAAGETAEATAAMRTAWLTRGATAISAGALGSVRAELEAESGRFTVRMTELVANQPKTAGQIAWEAARARRNAAKAAMVER